MSTENNGGAIDGEMDCIRRIAHGAQRGDWPYCVKVLREHAGNLILRDVLERQRLEIIRLRGLLKAEGRT